MKIEDIDFTPYYYVNGILDPVISVDECKALGGSISSSRYDTSQNARGSSYIDKLVKYQDRFQNPMPVSLRKQLLREMITG